MDIAFILLIIKFDRQEDRKVLHDVEVREKERSHRAISNVKLCELSAILVHCLMS